VHHPSRHDDVVDLLLQIGHRTRELVRGVLARPRDRLLSLESLLGVIACRMSFDDAIAHKLIIASGPVRYVRKMDRRWCHTINSSCDRVRESLCAHEREVCVGRCMRVTET
jgi:hypothetical protein